MTNDFDMILFKEHLLRDGSRKERPDELAKHGYSNIFRCYTRTICGNQR